MAGVLQHLRSSTLNKRPNPASMVDGQIAINYASGSPGAFFKDTNGNLVKVGPVHVGATAPNVSPASGGTAGNSLGEQWLDTSGGTYVFKVWDGVAWRSEVGEFVNTTGDTMTGALGIIAGSAGSPSLFFSGDSNTGLFSPGADQIALSAGGTGRLFIESNGRVGVGTGSPNTTLDVRGTIRATDSVNYVDVRGDDGAIELVRTSGAYIDFKDILADDFDVRIQQESNGLVFQTGGNGAASERVRITSAGFVGIGNSSPGAKLSIGNGSISLQNSSVAAVSDLGIGFALDANVQGRIYSPVGKSFAIQAGTAGSLTDAVTIDQSGNVGIGTTSPSVLLHAAGAVRVGAGNTSDAILEIGAGATGNRTAYIDLTGDTTYADYGLRIIRSNGGANAISKIIQRGTGDFALETMESAPIIFATNNTERLRITSAGFVGVGGSDPTEILDLRRANGSGNLGIRLVHVGQVEYKIGINDSDDKLYITNNNGNDAIGANAKGIVITPGGSVGIGTASPAHLLDVNGKIRGTNSSFALIASNGSGSGQTSIALTREGAPSDQKNWEILHGSSGDFTVRAINDTYTAGQDVFAVNRGSGLTIDNIKLFTNNGERLRIDGDGRLLVGASARRRVGTPFDPGGGVFFEGCTTGQYEAFTAVLNRTDNVGPVFCFGKSGGNTNGSNTIVANGDQLGVIRFAGADGSDLVSRAAEIICEVDGTPGNNDMPGRLIFATTTDGSADPTERMRIDNSGRLLVGTTGRSNFFNTGNTAGFQFEGQGGFGAFTRTDNDTFGAGLVFAKTRSSGNTIVQNNDTVGLLTFQGNDGSEFVECANIQAFVDGVPGANDMPGRLAFATTPDGGVIPIERMRITSGGTIRMGQSATDTPGFGNTTTGIGMEPANGALFLSRADGGNLLFLNSNLSTGTADAINFRRSDVLIGSVTTTTTATSYNTSSDYRLKENIVAVTDGIARLQQLKPSRFNFIADPARTVDGFLAHEVQDVVPEAITGEKDAVDDEGNPQYQGIDQSKMVPLVVAALQEAIGEIESLKVRLAAAGI